MRKTALHAATGTLALLLVATFWTSTLVSELLLGPPAVQAVKHAIAWYGLAALVLCMATTGATGLALARGRSGRLVDEKRRRMPLLGLNGLLVMVPSALFLNARASTGQLDTVFYAVQALELLVGAAQLMLLARNVRAGLRLSGRLRPARASA